MGALVGVVLIAQPEDIFGAKAESDVSGKAQGHLKGLAFGIFGLCGGVVSDRAITTDDL
jgi:hypothetical protein